MAGPVACAAVLTGLLSAWVASGGAGTLTRVRIQVTLAAVPMRAFTSRAADAVGAAGVYLTIRNLGSTPDELIAVRSPVSRHVVLTESARCRQPGQPSNWPGRPRRQHLVPEPARRRRGAREPRAVRGQADRPADAGVPPCRAGHHRRARHRPGHPLTARRATGRRFVTQLRRQRVVEIMGRVRELSGPLSALARRGVRSYPGGGPGPARRGGSGPARTWRGRAPRRVRRLRGMAAGGASGDPAARAPAARMPHDLPEREGEDDILLMLPGEPPPTAQPLRTVTARGWLPSLRPASHRKERPSCPA